MLMTSSFVCATLDLGSKKSTGTEPCGYYFLTFIYTHRQKLSNTTFFGDTVLEVAERNMWVMEIKYFEFYCKFYYFYEHFELKMIL